MNDATVLDLNNSIVNASIEIRKNSKTKLPDAIIAATTLVYYLVFFSRNINDFKNIKGLNCMNPWEL